VAHQFGTLTSDDQYFAGGVITTGLAAGAHPDDIAAACVVALAIQSGDIILPWSQDQVEIALAMQPTYIQIRALMVTAPHFLSGAYIWFATKIMGIPV